jgi:hypothetical protein
MLILRDDTIHAGRVVSFAQPGRPPSTFHSTYSPYSSTWYIYAITLDLIWPFLGLPVKVQARHFITFLLLYFLPSIFSQFDIFLQAAISIEDSNGTRDPYH